MKKLLLLAATVSIVSCAPGNKTEESRPYSQRMVESHGLVDFYCNRHHQSELDSAAWDYVSGLVANAVLKAWTLYPCVRPCGQRRAKGLDALSRKDRLL